MARTSREVHLVRRPRGVPVPEDFAIVARELGEPGEGEMEIETLFFSVDPYMRPRFAAEQALNEPLLGGALGRVGRSRHLGFGEGEIVRTGLGMREAALSDGRGVGKLAPDPDLPLSTYLNALGGTGMTAYGGMIGVGEVKAGDEVFVSTAAGAVGSVAAQIGKIKGARVVGSTGSAQKVRWLLDVAGLDAAFDYRARPVAEALAEVTPKGIDLYFENVGGDHLDAALARMNVAGRIPVCGMISMYNGQPAPVTGLFNLIYKRITMKGFVGSDFPHLADAFRSDMTQWLNDGRIKTAETVLKGIEAAPEGIIGLFTGANLGKMLIEV